MIWLGRKHVTATDFKHISFLCSGQLRGRLDIPTQALDFHVWPTSLNHAFIGILYIRIAPRIFYSMSTEHCTTQQSQHSIFSTMSYSNSNVNGGLDPFIIETPKTLRETDGRPRRIIACVACRKRRGRVSTSTFYFFVIVFISSRLQCKKPEESPKADCAFCRSRGIRCVVGQSLYIECLYMLSSEFCIQPGNLGNLTWRSLTSVVPRWYHWSANARRRRRAMDS